MSGSRVPRPLPPLLLLLVLPLLGACQRAFFAAVNAGGGGAVATAAYGASAWQQLDVYAPPQARAAPVVLFFYGGRWRDGRRADYAFVGEALARQGIVAVVADYRRHPEVTFPTFVEDAAAALRWTRDHIAAHGGDPARLFVAGHSAGAHLAAMLATDARHLAAVGMQPRELRGLIGLAGPYDFLPITDPDLLPVFAPRERWPQSQPVNFVDGDEPPALLLHGDDDRSVGPHNSASLARRLHDAGVRVDHRRYPGVGHVRILSALRYPRLAPTLHDTVQFVRAESAR
jgi:acetyl esterase/lipase